MQQLAYSTMKKKQQHHTHYTAHNEPTAFSPSLLEGRAGVGKLKHTKYTYAPTKNTHP